MLQLLNHPQLILPLIPLLHSSLLALLSDFNRPNFPRFPVSPLINRPELMLSKGLILQLEVLIYDPILLGLLRLFGLREKDLRVEALSDD